MDSASGASGRLLRARGDSILHRDSIADNALLMFDTAGPGPGGSPSKAPAIAAIGEGEDEGKLQPDEDRGQEPAREGGEGDLEAAAAAVPEQDQGLPAVIPATVDE